MLAICNLRHHASYGFNMASCDRLDYATRRKTRGGSITGYMLKGFREIWCPNCGNSSQRQKQWLVDLLKAA
ncbi:hypothetical protein TNCV_1895061 [Trichonephila clavipes]|nr:hypothetical protein TNCV_1895061 [Trichonephila clavipes]